MNFFSRKQKSQKPRGRRGLWVATMGTGLVIAFGLLFMVSAVHVSSTPQFCGSCHIMQPYYESWVNSSHGSIACVECHIAPGVTAEFRKKYEALSMVARYFTGTYSTNPWTEVEDAACLRCHERRLIQGREVFHNSLFDHRPHLTEVRRGMKLRCTSCHSQLVQGDHIAVTTSSCVLCHFKNETLGEGTADCALCHEPPTATMETASVPFDHADVSRFGMSCVWCHEHAADGHGGVPRERCYTCHNEQKRIQLYEDVDLLHQAHVTDHKIACMDCHLEIQHNAEPERVATDPSCNKCHTEGGHSAQHDLYAGIGGRGVERIPSPMFVAGVRCEGCHLEDEHGARTEITTVSLDDPDPTVARAGAVSCMACHGPEYYQIFQNWKRAVDTRLTAVEKQLRTTEKAIGAAGGEAWADAVANVRLVRQGKGIHNVNYALAVLARAHEQMNEARKGAKLTPLAQPWTALPAGSDACVSCHAGAEQQQGRFAGMTFSHAKHVGRGKLECTTCHRPHEERPANEVVSLDRQGCISCHHQKVEAECSTCHSRILDREIKVDLGDFSHRLHIEDVELDCSDCHETKPAGAYALNRETCADCHD